MRAIISPSSWRHFPHEADIRPGGAVVVHCNAPSIDLLFVE